MGIFCFLFFDLLIYELIKYPLTSIQDQYSFPIFYSSCRLQNIWRSLSIPPSLDESILTGSVHLLVFCFATRLTKTSKAFRFPHADIFKCLLTRTLIKKTGKRPAFSHGAGGGNRTPVYCLEGSHSTTKLHPHSLVAYLIKIYFLLQLKPCLL
jgi:hypothetical protein